ncbi:MAG TPA: PA2169 family four-helix-bundle protein [Fulvivirga sp.]|nr:PA2169 family four-helix-bundle protein [Fulvivirga sp.]
MSYQSKIIEQVNQLLEEDFEAEVVFQMAAENLSNKRLKQYFKYSAEQRKQFCEDLRSEIIRLGGMLQTPTHDFALHGNWRNFSKAVSTNDEELILKECIRAEERIRDRYKEVLSNKLPLTTKYVMENHLTNIKNRVIDVSALASEMELR